MACAALEGNDTSLTSNLTWYLRSWILVRGFRGNCIGSRAWFERTFGSKFVNCVLSGIITFGNLLSWLEDHKQQIFGQLKNCALVIKKNDGELNTTCVYVIP